MFAHSYRPTLRNTEAADEESEAGNLTMQSEYSKLVDLKLDQGFFKEANIRLAYNEVNLYDNFYFPGFKTSLDRHFLSVEQIKVKDSFAIMGEEGDPLFSVEIDLASLKHVYERA